MGSWSESCGFSGIEIGEGEYALVTLVGIPKYRETFTAESFYEMKTPLLRGTYNDYGYLRVEDDDGIIALFNHLSGLSLKNGDDFADRDEHAVEGMDRYWIREDIHRGLVDLKQDFPYYSGGSENGYKCIPVKNIGGSWELHRQKLSKALTETAEKMEKAAAMTDKMADMSASERYDLIEVLSDRPLRELFGYSRYGINWPSLAKARPEGVTAEAFVEAYRRHWVLTYAAIELRKKFLPSEQIGPQWGGHDASVKFAKQVLAVQKERRNAR